MDYKKWSEIVLNNNKSPGFSPKETSIKSINEKMNAEIFHAVKILRSSVSDRILMVGVRYHGFKKIQMSSKKDG